MSQIRAVELAEEAGFRRGIETAAVVVDRARGEGFVDFRTLRDRIRALASPASSPAAPAPVAAPLCTECYDDATVVWECSAALGHDGPHQWQRPAPREAAPEACPDHPGEKWIEGTPCPKCGGKRVWHSGLGSTTTDEHQKCLGTCGMERTVDGIDS